MFNRKKHLWSSSPEYLTVEDVKAPQIHITTPLSFPLNLLLLWCFLINLWTLTYPFKPEFRNDFFYLTTLSHTCNIHPVGHKCLKGFLLSLSLHFLFPLSFFLKIFFWYGPFLKSLLNLLQYCFCFTFCFLGREVCGILAPQHRDRTRTPCIGRWSLNHWTTREVLPIVLIQVLVSLSLCLSLK